MSYDLSFSRRDGGALAASDFAAWFRGRPGYELKDAQAWYSNDDTGVYFGFEHADGDAEAAAPRSVASFNLNFFRPPFFALEAAPELTAFVQRFDLVVSDPQTQGMGEGEFSEEGFLRGWNAGNRFGYAAIVHQHPDSAFPAAPEAKLLAAWRWNRARAELQAGLGESAFVPRVMFFAIDGETRSAVIWGDAIPVLLPAVDMVLVARQELAPRRLFGRKMDVCAVPWGELMPVVGSYPVAQEPQRHLRLLHERPPRELVDWVRGLKPAQALQTLPFEQLLSAELLAAVRAEEPPKAVTFGPDAPPG